MADLDPQAVVDAAKQWAAYQEGKKAGEPHDEAAEGAEAGVKLPGKVQADPDTLIDQTNPVPEDVDGPGYPKP